jgi:hypothetical protein
MGPKKRQARATASTLPPPSQPPAKKSALDLFLERQEVRDAALAVQLQSLQGENKKLWGEVRRLTAQEPPAVPELQAPRVEQVVEQPSGSQLRGERWALPVDAHIEAALKEKVKQKEAIDFSLLLEQKMFSPPKEMGQVLLSESEWVQAWNVFQVMHGRFFPLEVAGLADHMRNVLKL